jgi:exopolysaccharide biosynthesis WecB/TagA/CpsF family protein
MRNHSRKKNHKQGEPDKDTRPQPCSKEKLRGKQQPAGQHGADPGRSFCSGVILIGEFGDARRHCMPTIAFYLYTDQYRLVLRQLLQKIAVADDLDRLVEAILTRASDRSCVVSFCNAHAVNLAARSPEFFAALTGSDWLLRDGIGVKLAMRLFKLPEGLNANGTDLIPRILAALPRAARLVVYGTSSPWLEQAVARLRRTGLTVVGSLSGFLDPADYLADAAELKPTVIVLGMGMPKQELLARALRCSLPSAPLIINGGAILDFLAGRHPRAPLWVRRLGSEWLFRLAREPERLWKRYLLGNVEFILRMTTEWARVSLTLPHRPPRS